MSTKTDWQDAFPTATNLTPAQRRVVAETKADLGYAPYVTLDPMDYSDGEDADAAVLIWTVPAPWTMNDDNTEWEREFRVFNAEADGSCHIGGNVSAASWRALRDALARAGVI